MHTLYTYPFVRYIKGASTYVGSICILQSLRWLHSLRNVFSLSRYFEPQSKAEVPYEADADWRVAIQSRFNTAPSSATNSKPQPCQHKSPTYVPCVIYECVTRGVHSASEGGVVVDAVQIDRNYTNWFVILFEKCYSLTT